MLEMFKTVCQIATGICSMCAFTVAAVVLLKKFVFISKKHKEANDLKKLKKLQEKVSKREAK